MSFDLLPSPKAVEELDYNTILNELLSTFKAIVPDYELLESDRFSSVLEAIAYREMLLRQSINYKFKAMLLPTAIGSDLDNIVALYGVLRNKGVYPQALVEFELSKPLTTDIIVPVKTVFVSDTGLKSRLIKNVVVVRGSLKAQGSIELLEYVKTSEIKTEIIQTPLPFILKAKQLTNFKNGDSIETDSSLRERAVLKLSSITTAGSRDSYRFHSLSADTRIQDVAVTTTEPGVVHIAVLSDSEDETILENLQNRLSAKTIRPITDIIETSFAVKKSVSVKANIELLDILNQYEVDKAIKAELPKMVLGEDLNISRLYKILHTNGVYRVNILSPSTDIKAGENEYISVADIEINYSLADY